MLSSELLAAEVRELNDRARAYKTAGREPEAVAFARARHRLTSECQRCQRCGYLDDEHDFDGKCPQSEDDAAYYREQ